MRLKTIVSSLALLGLASHAMAQSAAPEQRVTITGSSIKRIASEGALPLQVIRRAELEREGISNAEQLVMMLSSNGTGADNLASNADVVSGAARGSNGLSAANLRGQGSTSTLVLLNGRRLAAHGLNGSAVDLNQIPFGAIERVEVLKDGASAIYGTDAIGGVINFILRTDFQGLNVEGFIDIPQNRGGEIYTAKLLGGLGKLQSDGFNVMGAVSFRQNKALRGDQRSFVNTFQPNRGLSVDTRGTPHATIVPLGASTATTINGFTTTGTIINSLATAPFVPGSTTVRASGGINVLDLPGGAGCSSRDGMAPYDDRLWDFPEAQFACAWDTGRAAVLQQPLESVDALLRGSMTLAGSHLVSLELVGSQVDSAKRFSNLQLIPNTSTQNFAFPRTPSNAAVYDDIFNRAVAVFPALEARRGQPIGYRWRCMDCGTREIETTARTGRAFIGAEGPLIGWDYRTGISYAFSDVSSTLGSGYYYRNTLRDSSGAVIVNGIVDALNRGNINPFLFAGQSQSAQALADLQATSARGVTLYGGKYETTQADFSVSGEVATLPAGAVLAAVGLDARQEKYSFKGDGRLAGQRPVIIAAPFDDGNAVTIKRDITALYAEVIVPVIRGMEITGAVRHDRYSDFGSTTNPKVSFLYKPTTAFLVRASYNEAFRAPNFNQLYNAPTSPTLYSGRDVADPANCPGGIPNTSLPGCAALTTLTTTTSGNLKLQPETAKQSSVGFVWEPIPGFSVGVDWWHIERTARIQQPSERDVIDNAAAFPTRLQRNAAGTLVNLDLSWANIGDALTEGLEVNLRGSGLAMGGRWSAALDGTYLLERKSRRGAASPFGASEIGKFSFTGDLALRWKHTASTSFSMGSWTGSFSQTYRSGYLDQVLPGVASGRIVPPNWKPKVDEYITYNASVGYSGIKNTTFTLGIKNLFDKDPPFAITYDSASGAGSSWEPRVASPRGRAFTLRAEYRFF